MFLRVIAIGIAIAGLIDPAWTVSRQPLQQLVAIRMTSAPPTAVEQALTANLPGWDVGVREWQSRLPCGTGERCVVIADGSMDAIVPEDLSKPLSLVSVSGGDGPNVSVRSVVVSRAHQSAAGVARVELSSTVRDQGASTVSVRILDGGAVIGSATQQWSGADATIDVPWWPVDIGARTLRVEAVPLEGERITIDNQLDVGVDVTATRAPVLVFDARPSWSSTFVRRAIEDDARFVVGYRARLAPAVSAGTANGRLDAAALDLASVLVIGGPDALTAADVTLLEQFVRVRGGTLVLLAERAPARPWSRLLSGTWTEHLAAKPEAVGSLHATEVLRAGQVPGTATVIARSGSAASIVVSPAGQGRVVLSGAMDAWRYRDLDAGSFDRFWRSLIAEGAAWGEATQLSFDEGLAARGSRARFTIRDRRMVPGESETASATARCGLSSEALAKEDDAPATSIRLWPSGAQGAFVGDAPLAGNGSCRVEATVNARLVSGAIAVAENPLRGVEATLAKLERRVRAAGGVVMRAGEEAALARAINTAPAPAAMATTVHPMRAAWWILPFAGCLSIEWWLRRRSGRR